MEDHGPRYAVYFVPELESNLFRFGSAVLRYNSYAGEPVQAPEEFSIDADEWCKITDEPRRYGFHATLKAPFKLSPLCTEAQLISGFQSFAALGRGLIAIRPVIRMLSGFSAVVPSQPSPAVDSLAVDCTTIFDAFRAPMSAQERARRLASGLNQSQIENLDRWGYPYLFADFRFHMTLTGKIQVDRRADVLATLQRIFQRMCGDQDIAIDRLTLVKQDTALSAFRVLSQALLRGAH